MVFDRQRHAADVAFEAHPGDLNYFRESNQMATAPEPNSRVVGYGLLQVFDLILSSFVRFVASNQLLQSRLLLCPRTIKLGVR